MALGDPRGQALLTEAHARLQEQSAQMEDEVTRQMFLENVPENRELAAELARLSVVPDLSVGGSAAQPPAPRKEGVEAIGQAGKKKEKKGKKQGRGVKGAKRGEKGKKKAPREAKGEKKGKGKARGRRGKRARKDE